MFKRIIDNYFKHKFFQRFLIFTILFTLFFAGVDLFVNKTIALFSPHDEQVCAQMEEMAESIILYKNFDSLEIGDVLHHYTHEYDTQKGTVTVTLYGHGCERIVMVFSDYDFSLLSAKKLCNVPTVTLLAICAFYYVAAGSVMEIATEIVLRLVRKTFAFAK